MPKTDTRNAKDQLKNFLDDITYALEQEDATIQVSRQDIARLNMVVQTIKSLEADYERVMDKITHGIRLRAKEVDDLNTDDIAKELIAIERSERQEC